MATPAAASAAQATSPGCGSSMSVKALAQALQDAQQVVERASTSPKSDSTVPSRPVNTRNLVVPSAAAARTPSARSEHWDGKDEEDGDEVSLRPSWGPRDRGQTWSGGCTLARSQSMVVPPLSQPDTDKQMKSLWAAQETLQEAFGFQLTKLEERLSSRLQALEADAFGDKLKGRLRALEDKVEAHLVNRLEVLCSEHLTKFGREESPSNNLNKDDADQALAQELAGLKERLQKLEESAATVRQTIRRSITATLGKPPLFKTSQSDGRSAPSDVDSQPLFMRMMSTTDGGDPDDDEDDLMCARDSDYGFSDRQMELLLAKHAARRRSSRGLGLPADGCPEDKVIELEQRMGRLQKLEEEHHSALACLEDLRGQVQSLKEAAASRVPESAEHEESATLKIKELESSIAALKDQLSQTQMKADDAAAEQVPRCVLQDLVRVDSLEGQVSALPLVADMQSKLLQLSEQHADESTDVRHLSDQVLQDMTDQVIKLAKQEVQSLREELQSAHDESAAASDLLSSQLEALLQADMLESHVSSLPVIATVQSQLRDLVDQRSDLSSRIDTLAEQVSRTSTSQQPQQLQQLRQDEPQDMGNRKSFSTPAHEQPPAYSQQSSPVASAMEQELGALMQKVESLQLAVAEVSQASPASKARAETVVRRLDFLENGLQEFAPVLGKVTKEGEAVKSLTDELAQLRQAQDTCAAQVAQLLATARREDTTAMVRDLQEEFAAMVCKIEMVHEEHSRLSQRTVSLEAGCVSRLDGLESSMQGWSEQLQSSAGKQQEAVEGLLSQLKALESHLSGHVATWEADHQKEVQAALSEKMDLMEQEHGWLKEQLRVGLEAQELAVAVKDEKMADLEGTLHWLREQMDSLQQLQHESKSLQKDQSGIEYVAARVQAIEVQLLKMPELGVLSTRLGMLEVKLAANFPEEAFSTRVQRLEEQAQDHEKQLQEVVKHTGHADSKLEQIGQRIQKLEEAKPWLLTSQAAQVAPSPEWTDGMAHDSGDQERSDRQLSELQRREHVKHAQSSPLKGAAILTPDHNTARSVRHGSPSGSPWQEAGHHDAQGIDSGLQLSADTIRESLVRLGLLHDLAEE